MITRIHSFSEGWSDPKRVKALFVPGGNASEMWIADLKEAVDSVREVILKYSIGYYGACAGGIIATSSHFERTYVGTTSQSLGFKTKAYSFLQLFPSSDIAPLIPIVNRPKFSAADFALRPIRLTSGKVMTTAHILGTGYLDVRVTEETDILATYTDLAAQTFLPQETIVPERICESLCYKPEGKGVVVLTGSHPEIDSQSVMHEEFKSAFNMSDREQQAAAETLRGGDAERKFLLRENFERMGIHCKKV